MIKIQVNKLGNKADSIHKHDVKDIKNIDTKLNKYSKEDHNHTTSDITDLETELDKYTLKNDFDTHNHDGVYSKTDHTHIINNITDLQTKLDQYSLSSHNHDTTYVKQDTFNTHTHEISDITDLNISDYATNEQLEEKANELKSSIATKADAGHTHEISDVTDLNISNYATTEQLAEKANLKHTHNSEDISDKITESITGYSSDESIFKYDTENKRLCSIPIKSMNILYLGAIYNGHDASRDNLIFSEEQINVLKEEIERDPEGYMWNKEGLIHKFTLNESKELIITYEFDESYIDIELLNLNISIENGSIVSTDNTTHNISNLTAFITNVIDNNDKITTAKIVNHMITTKTNNINSEINNKIIAYDPEAMNTKKLITAQVVKSYVEEKTNNGTGLYKSAIGDGNYFLMLIPAEEGAYFKGAVIYQYSIVLIDILCVRSGTIIIGEYKLLKNDIDDVAFRRVTYEGKDCIVYKRTVTESYDTVYCYCYNSSHPSIFKWINKINATNETEIEQYLITNTTS